MHRKTRYLAAAASIAAWAGWTSTGLADDDRDDWRGHGWGDHDQHRSSGLADTVRDATRRFRDLDLAIAEGYGQFLGCVSGPQEGAMGVHFANGTLVGDDVLDGTRPEVLVYEPRANGDLRLVAVEYLVIAETWDASHTTPPVLEGQSFHFTDSPNRYGLPPFYALHVWAWKHNPHGTFVNWNPNVSCEHFDPEAP